MLSVPFGPCGFSAQGQSVNWGISMPDSYVIDGYNLIHALGMIRRHINPGDLEDSRGKLLAFLAKAFGDEAARVRVVFDAKHAPGGMPKQQQRQGLHIHFSPKNQSADDWIEKMIEEEPQPRSLVVISNDMRLQSAARHRGARAWSHEALLDFLEKRAKPTAAPADEERLGELTPEELRRWLKEFARLESDPELKEFFDHDRFE
jgi:predicted RNA-binding protein with PIN domain